MTHIAVAGGGIAGLAAALALAQAGAAVTVFEAAATLSDIGAGVQLSPNATRVLRRLGVLDAVAPLSARPERVRIRNAGSGADLAAVPLGDVAEARYGAPFLVAHRGDVQAALLAAVRAHERIHLTTGARLVAVASDAAAVELRFADGTATKAEALVGADGLRSAVRRFVAPGEDAEPAFAHRVAWRALVPAEAAPAHARVVASNLWLGAGAHLVHYQVRGGRFVNVVAITGARDLPGGDATSWAVPGDGARLRAAFAGWCAEAGSLLEAAPGWAMWPLFHRPPLDRWSRGTVTLAGDAAHPMLPFLAQGAAQAIEDAAALGDAVAGTPSIAAAFKAYEERRRSKATRVQRESASQARIYHLPPPAAAARDLAFRLLGPARMLRRYDWLYGT